MHRVTAWTIFGILILFQALATLAQPPAAGPAPLLDPSYEIWSRRSPEILRVRFETSQGDFVVEAHRQWAPQGVDRLFGLAASRFFDDSRFFPGRRRFHRSVRHPRRSPHVGGVEAAD